MKVNVGSWWQDREWVKAHALPMKDLAGVVRLPLGPGRWSGVAGSVFGQGTGSSVDFHDQRQYLPGDDPRHINWQAYARTGHYMMKLYRQEVAPRVDVMFDVSASMCLTQAKAARCVELLYLCIESGVRQGASVRVFKVGGTDAKEMKMEKLRGYELDLEEGEQEAGRHNKEMRHRSELFSEVPMRTGALRVWISDLLFEEAPTGMVSGLIRDKGRGIVLAPSCVEEAHPEWDGNIEFEDCESLQIDRRRVEVEVLKRYEQAYERHFRLWSEECLRRGVCIGRVPAEGGVLKALMLEALRTGAVVME